MASVNWILKVEDTIGSFYTGPQAMRNGEVNEEISAFLSYVKRANEEPLEFSKAGRKILRKAIQVCSR